MISRRQAHWHPEAFDEPCNHDAEPSTNWPVALYVVFLAVALLLGGYLVWALVTSL